jgi:hypothetical protein
MKPMCFLALISLLCFGCQSGHRNLPKEFSAVLRARQISKSEMNTSGLPKCSDCFPLLKSQPDIMFYRLPERKNVWDAFTYSIALSKHAQKYWIIEQGGFAGTTTVYGPATVP